MDPRSFARMFIARNGALGFDPLKLRVERLPGDLLLHTVPWPVGVIRTPWMAEPLEVDWND